MGHNIWVDTRNNAHIFVGRNIKAWHELGVVVAGCLTWHEAMEAAGLNWSVNKEPLYDKNGNKLPTYGIFRDTDNAFLGSVGERYVTIQNKDAFEWIDCLIGQEGAHYDSAGALGNGEVVFCSAHLPSAGFEVVPGDEHKVYLLFKTSHDGSLSAIIKATDVRTVCQNTLNQALSSSGFSMSIRHTKSSADRLQQAKMIMDSGKKTAQALHDKMVELSERQVTKKSLGSILEKLFPQDGDGNISTRTKNNIEDILNLFDWCDGGAFPQIKGTAYSLVNAVTEFTDKLRSSKGDMRSESALFGTGDAFKEKAFNVIYDVAGKEMPHKGKTMTMVLDRNDAPVVDTPKKRTFLSSISLPSSLA